VPGLAERRPSVLKGDLIYVRVSLGNEKWERTQYEGVVADVRDTCIWIGGFDKKWVVTLLVWLRQEYPWCSTYLLQ